MRRFSAPDQLDSVVGEELGVSAWRTVTAEMVSLFGGTVGDRRPVRADGFLVLGMIPRMMSEILTVDGVDLVLNKGVHRARFGTPVQAGCRVRARALVVSARRRPRDFWEILYRVSVEVQADAVPVVVADTVFLYATDAAGAGPVEG